MRDLGYFTAAVEDLMVLKGVDKLTATTAIWNRGAWVERAGAVNCTRWWPGSLALARHDTGWLESVQ